MDSIVPWQVIPVRPTLRPSGRLLFPNPIVEERPVMRSQRRAGPTLAMGPARGLGRSLGGSHLRRLFANLPGIKDEFERIGILVFLHQLEIHEPLGIGHCRAVIEPIPGRFKQ